MSDQETKKKKYAPLLRAVLAAKGKVGIPLHMVCREFEEDTFSPLNFKEMGYGSLEQYLRDCPEICRISRAPEGYLVVKGVATEEDAHVFKLVDGQRKNRKKKPKRMHGLTVKRKANHFMGGKQPNFRPRVNNNFLTLKNSDRGILGTPPPSYKKMRESPGPKFELAPRFQKKPTNPFVNKVQNQVFEHVKNSQKNKSVNSNNRALQMTIFNNDSTSKSTHFSSSNQSNSSYETNGKAKTVLSASALLKLEKQIRELLKTKENGLWATRILPEFKKMFGETLPEDIRDIIHENFQAFIKFESPMPALEILYLKEEEEIKPPVQSVATANLMEDQMKSVMNGNIDGHTVSKKKEEALNGFIPNGTVPNGTVPNGTISNGTISNGTILESHIEPMSTPCNIESVNTITSINTPQIPQLELPNIGDEFKVYVCHVESLDRFFVQFSDSAISDLVEEMQGHYENSEVCKNLEKLCLNDYCCARYSKDRVWCRAKILSVKEQKNIVNVSYGCRVIFVDYGNDEYVISTELKCLSVEFAKMPAQAIQCSFHNLYPLRDGGTWSEKVIDHFKQLTDNVELTMCVKQRNGNVLGVDLVDGNGQSVSAYFCTNRIAKMTSVSNESTDETSSIKSCSKTSPSTPRTSGLPEYVSIPENQDYIDVSVCQVNSTNDIVIVMVGPDHSDQLDKLEEKMNKSYDKDSLPADSVEVNKFYVVPYDGDWVRAKLLAINDNELEVFLLDHGNKTFVARDEIKELHPKFYSPPFQAIACSMTNVPESFDAETLQWFTDVVLGKDLIGYVVERPEAPGLKMSIELYDTTNDNDDININSEVSSKIENDKHLSPKFPDKLGDTCNAYIAHISAEGDIFVQILGSGTEKLEILMEDMSSHFTQTRASEIVHRPDVGTLCCAKYHEDGGWYRARVTKVMKKERNVEVEFIDYGNKEVIQMLFIRNPDAVNKQVISLPPQAVKCRIADYSDLNLTEETYLKMRDFSQSLEHVNISVMEYKDSVPYVNIHIPSEQEETGVNFVEKYQLVQAELEAQTQSLSEDVTDRSVFEETLSVAGSHTTYEDISVASEGSFCTINPIRTKLSSNTLLSEYDVINNLPEKEDVPRPRSRSESPAVMYSPAWGIPQAVITERIIEGVILDSHDPSKFCFIPFSQWNALESMHVEMINHYQNSVAENVVFSVGDVCAAYHTKHEIWYRAVIVTEIEDQVVVKYLDFSSTVEVESAKNIRPLHSKFKKLPFLAVRCSLHGVSPIGAAKTWDTEAATYFNELVINDTFQVEVIEGFCNGDNSKPLEVHLIGGTDDDKLFFVHEKLIQLGLAKRDLTKERSS